MPSGELQGGMQTIQRPCAGGQAVLKRVKVVVEYGGEPFSRIQMGVTGGRHQPPHLSREWFGLPLPQAHLSWGTSLHFYDMILSQFYFPRLWRFGRLYFLILRTRVDRSMPRVAAISLVVVQIGDVHLLAELHQLGHVPCVAHRAAGVVRPGCRQRRG